jgi:uncharacterized membrane protein YeiH
LRYSGVASQGLLAALFGDAFAVTNTVGLVAFATTGAIVATETAVSAFGVVAVATIYTVGGGAFADILLDRASFILFDDFYATCAVLGASAYLLAGSLGAAGNVAAVVCAVVTVVSRLVAVTYDWELPTVQGLGLMER